MGCNVSRLDSHGPTFPARLRPLLLQRFDEITTRRHAGRALKDPTPSKKELLDKDVEEENNACQHLLAHDGEDVARGLKDEAPDGVIGGIAKTMDHNNNDHNVKENRVVEGVGFVGMRKDEKKEEQIEDDHAMDGKIVDALTDADEDDDDDDDEDDERRIGHEDDDAFPGSPSFRVYFEDTEVNKHIDIGKKDVLRKIVSSDNGVPSKESPVEKKVKKGKKRRSFRKVLPKNLLSVKSCYTPSHSSHDNTVLLERKTTT